jgi:hypothetical protein
MKIFWIKLSVLVVIMLISVVFFNVMDQKKETKKGQEPSFLFVVSAEEGKIVKENYVDKLVLSKIDDHLLYFSDRPNRIAGMSKTTPFFKAWDKMFESSMPNVAIAYKKSEKDKKTNESFAIELKTPQKIDGAWVFEIVKLKGTQIEYVDLGPVWLFIDDIEDMGFFSTRSSGDSNYN